MRALIQRVQSAAVSIDGKEHAAINAGLLVFLGVGASDTMESVKTLAEKILKLRLFEDDSGKMNLDVQTVHGDLLIVSQFTLWANCKKGNRPSFIQAAKPDHAQELYQAFIHTLAQLCPSLRIKSGVFGADMAISLINDGPVTIWLDQADW